MPDDTEHTDPAAAPGPFAGLRKTVFMLGVLAVAWLFVAQVLPRLLLPRQQEIPAPAHPAAIMKSEPDDALRHRLDALEDRIKILEAKPAAETPAANEERMVHVEEALGRQQEALQAMKAQLGGLQSADTHRLSLLIAFGQLREAALSGAPFTDPLSEFSQIAAPDAALQPFLATLQPFAAAGAPTLDSLKKQLDALIPQALSPQPSGTLARNLQSLVRIRKTGEPAGNDDEAVLARAETALARGDVETSLKEAAAASPASAQALLPWMDKAKALLAIRNALDALQRAIVKNPQPAPGE
ncbi:MAG: hypothetical protein KGJ06_05055 [Pseudomonadota bacterium]|nr:hypothetical protein [Pseudomonadota bacterium]